MMMRADCRQVSCGVRGRADCNEDSHIVRRWNRKNRVALLSNVECQELDAHKAAVDERQAAMAALQASVKDSGVPRPLPVLRTP